MNVQDLAPSSAGALYGRSHFILHANTCFSEIEAVFLSVSTGFMNTVGALMGMFPTCHLPFI